MGSGPNGSGITISKPDPSAPKETLQQRELRLRQERAARLREHAEQQRAFQAGDVKQDQERHEDAAQRLEVRVRCRRVWAITLASWVASARLLPARARAHVCTRLMRLAQYRVGRGPWQSMPFKVTP